MMWACSLRRIANAWSLPVLFMTVVGPPAAASSLTVFDFSDFPRAPGVIDDEINTTVYGCRGKPFCTNGDVQDANDNGISSVSTTRDGIKGKFSRPPTTFPGGVSPAGGLGPGNVEGTGDFNAYVADFSKGLYFAQVELFLNPESELGDFAFLEIWSGPGAGGTLLGRTETEDAPGPFEGEILSLSAPRGTSFRSIRFGIGLDIPRCESGCYYDEEVGEQGFAGDIGVKPIPEPSAAVVFAVGLSIVVRHVRRRA